MGKIAFFELALSPDDDSLEVINISPVELANIDYLSLEPEVYARLQDQNKSNFNICSGCSYIFMEIWTSNEIHVQSDIHYAVKIPFSVGLAGVNVGAQLQIQIHVPEGKYALVYELKFRYKNDAEYTNYWYQDSEQDAKGCFCRLTFVPQDLVEAQELIPWDVEYFENSK